MDGRNLVGYGPWGHKESDMTEQLLSFFLIFPSDMNSQLIRKVPDAGKDFGPKRRTSEDTMAGWHHGCNEHELGQISGDGEGPERPDVLQSKRLQRIRHYGETEQQPPPLHFRITTTLSVKASHFFPSLKETQIDKNMRYDTLFTLTLWAPI